jgi:hypothetical protein
MVDRNLRDAEYAIIANREAAARGADSTDCEIPTPLTDSIHAVATAVEQAHADPGSHAAPERSDRKARLH